MYFCHFYQALLILLISGHVYNAIQSPGFMMQTAQGNVYIYRARRVQLQAEAFIVTTICKFKEC